MKIDICSIMNLKKMQDIFVCKKFSARLRGGHMCNIPFTDIQSFLLIIKYILLQFSVKMK